MARGSGIVKDYAARFEGLYPGWEGPLAAPLRIAPDKDMPNQLLRSLPSIDRMLLTPTAVRLSDQMGRDRVRDLLREISDELRDQITGNVGQSSPSEDLTPELLPDLLEERLKTRARLLLKPSLRRVINASGVILHTNLGRAPLARAALEAISEIASGYSNLEYNLETGERGRRDSHCASLIARLTQAQSAVVANNNAAAVLLVLNTLAQGGEVIVSRGELIEIGGSFRIPDVMEKSGAILREVGTTNRTRIADYADAINERTRLILRVHPSNYRIIGFTERPSAAEVAELGTKSAVPSYEDLGSGCLIDLSPYGISDEPVVAQSIRDGISVVSFSGDKMLGGPQAGIIAGSRAVIDRVRKNPLMRALRVDKLTYAALEATLRLYDRGIAQSEVPVIGRIAATIDQVEERATRFASLLAAKNLFRVSLEPGQTVIGGGSAPGVSLPTILVTIESPDYSASVIESLLRSREIPVIARTERDRVLIDLRTVAPDEESIIIEALEAISSSPA
jgi:L-seryl-tRNA(Ser) seleniumtransferase